MSDRCMKKVKIIAVDFDGTLCENNYPKIGEPNHRLIEYLKLCKTNGDKLILWSCRKDELLKEAVEWCKKFDLYFDAVNENLPDIINAFGDDTRKIFANEYIDDRNTNCNIWGKFDDICWKEQCNYCLNNNGCHYIDNVKDYIKAVQLLEFGCLGVYGRTKFKCDYFAMDHNKYANSLGCTTQG